MSRIVVIDYGMGNLGSVVNAFERLGASCMVACEAGQIRDARAIVLPGVGAFHTAMENIRDRGLDEALNEQVILKKKPFLGICLGMQLLAQDSVESEYSTGLGWIRGHVQRLAPQRPHRVPHVGWNEIRPQPGACLFDRLSEGAHFFFDHSYHFECAREFVAATCEHGGQWVAAVQWENILAVQFHPEKSQRNGLRVLRNFLSFIEKAWQEPC